MKNISSKYPKSGRVKIEGAWQSEDGLLEGFGSTGKNFVEGYEKICREDDEKRAEWIEKLRSLGVKAAHQDDGWHNRRENYFGFSYPHFNDGVKVGDMVALGDYEKFIIVRVTKRGGLISRKYYYYPSTPKGD